MTVGAWLAAHEGNSPPHLMAEVRRALGSDLARDVGEAPARCVDAAERLVGRLVDEGGMDRDSALSLLAADALVTFAFEAAAASPDTLRDQAVAAMRTLGTLG